MTGLFKTPKTPEVKPSTPIVDEEALKKKRKENIRKQQQRTGRSSTILSDREELG